MCWKCTTILQFEELNRTCHYVDTVILWCIVLAWTDQNRFLETRCLVPHINSTITSVFQENSLIKVVCYHNQNYRENKSTSTNMFSQRLLLTPTTREVSASHTEKQGFMCACFVLTQGLSFPRAKITEIIWWTLTHNSIHDISVHINP